MNIRDRIEGILLQRHAEAEKIKEQHVTWNDFRDRVTEIEALTQELQGATTLSEFARESLADFDSEGLRKEIDNALDRLDVVENRFSRKTINIGVSGRARVGKSTLLQSISGLSDEQIPTGSGVPVTAVRSAIFHSENEEKATLLLHDYESFRDNVLGPYHKKLELGPPPATARMFQKYEYPDPTNAADPFVQKIRDQHSLSTMLVRLRSMQSSFPSYQDLLTGAQQDIPLSELRRYVAYPTSEEQLDPAFPRPYLAVRDVRIHCRFPEMSVTSLGVIDLPGLGEVAAEAEEEHVKGLQNEVDFVVMVKRPVEGLAFWNDGDSAGANLLDKARGAVQDRRDFASILINRGGDDEILLRELRNSILRDANEGVEGKYFSVLEANATDAEAVRTAVLQPVLEHLATRLPEMDRQVREKALRQISKAAGSINTRLNDLKKTLTMARGTTLNEREVIEEAAMRARDNLVATLTEVLDKYRDLSETAGGDPRFHDVIEETANSTRAWIQSGLGKESSEVWKNAAQNSLRTEKGSGRFVTDEMNRLRIKISHDYQKPLDGYFQEIVNDLLNQVGEGFRDEFPSLLLDEEPSDVLPRLADLFENAREQCSTLSNAVEELLATRIEYRMQLHPRARKALNQLTAEVKTPEGLRPQVISDASDDGVDTLYEDIQQLAIQANHQTKKAIEEEADLPSKILFTALEQFEDAIARSGSSRVEFKRFAFSYADAFLSEEFKSSAAENELLEELRTSVDELSALLGNKVEAAQ